MILAGAVAEAFPKRLYLFDIDGTLITSGGAGETSLREAVREFSGSDVDFSTVTIAGNTDTAIARHLLSLRRTWSRRMRISWDCSTAISTILPPASPGTKDDFSRHHPAA